MATAFENCLSQTGGELQRQTCQGHKQIPCADIPCHRSSYPVLGTVGIVLQAPVKDTDGQNFVFKNIFDCNEYLIKKNKNSSLPTFLF